MRRAGLAAATLSLLGVATACVPPSDRRPGTALRGELAGGLPEDWSFSDAHPEIAVEVTTPWLLPHSVTIWCASLEGELYVGARDPGLKYWAQRVRRVPEVRIKIGDTLYEAQLEQVRGRKNRARIREAYAAKYDLPPPGEDAPPVRYWVVRPRSEDG